MQIIETTEPHGAAMHILEVQVITGISLGLSCESTASSLRQARPILDNCSSVTASVWGLRHCPAPRALVCALENKAKPAFLKQIFFNFSEREPKPRA